MIPEEVMVGSSEVYVRHSPTSSSAQKLTVSATVNVPDLLIVVIEELRGIVHQHGRAVDPGRGVTP